MHAVGIAEYEGQKTVAFRLKQDKDLAEALELTDEAVAKARKTLNEMREARKRQNQSET